MNVNEQSNSLDLEETVTDVCIQIKDKHNVKDVHILGGVQHLLDCQNEIQTHGLLILKRSKTVKSRDVHN